VQRTVKWLWTTGCLLLSTSGTACFVPKSTGLLMQDDIAALKGDVRTLRHDLDMQHASETEQMQQALQKLQQLTQALQDYNQTARSTDAEFNSQMERMIHDVQDLRGAVEVNEHRLGQTEQTLAQRLDALAKQHAEGGGEDTTAASALPTEKKEALAFAAKLLKDGKVAEARAAYRGILKLYPKAPGTADEAYLRLGESYLQEKHFDKALREYIHIVEKFGNGALADDAYYKIGICSLELGKLDDAQTFFSEIVTNHRRSPWLKSAHQKLDEVTRKLEKKPRPRSGPPRKAGS
jgi:TolA-binding protein